MRARGSGNGPGVPIRSIILTNVLKYDIVLTKGIITKEIHPFRFQYLRENDFDTTQLWRSITDMIIKTMVLAEPHILHAYRMCRPGHTPGTFLGEVIFRDC